MPTAGTGISLTPRQIQQPVDGADYAGLGVHGGYVARGRQHIGMRVGHRER